jgi:hypothetical protein
MMADVPDDETIALRATVIDGNGYPGDYQVVWRSLSIGRIMKGAGSPGRRVEAGPVSLGLRAGTFLRLGCDIEHAGAPFRRGERRPNQYARFPAAPDLQNFQLAILPSRG